MQVVEDNRTTVEVFENDMLMFLQMFCEENGIEEMRKETQSVWNSALRYIYKNVFKDTGVLKQHSNIYNSDSIMPSNYNSYDYDIILQVLDIYIYDMCMRNNKEVSIIGFSTLTGIDTETIYNWGRDNSKLSNRSSDIYKKLNKMREESLSNKLADGKQNPVGVIAMLNRHYGWASPYTADSNRRKAALTDAELPSLADNSSSVVQIDDKNSE